MPSALHHLAIEQAVANGGILATVLRPGTFGNNLNVWAHSVRSGNVVYGPYAKSSLAPIDEADIAAVAVAALTKEGHLGKTYPMIGPQALTRTEQLNAIATAIGKQLHYQEILPEAFAQEIGKCMSQPIIKMLLDYRSDTVANPDAVLPTVEQVTGQKARSLAESAREHAKDFMG